MEANMLVEVLEPTILRMPELSDDAFFDLCTSNEENRIERTAEGRVIIMAGTGGKTGARNLLISGQLMNWTIADDRGIAFDSSTMFLLPNRAMRSPDASWVSRTRWNELTSEQQDKYIPLCPEFVVELTSPSDRLPEVTAKMSEWIENGARLGWIIDPTERTVHVYRPEQPVEKLQDPSSVSGEGPVAGFTLDLRRIFGPKA
jgi:Uma2 family endonuclease